jgi:hypothetical protein
LATEKRLRPAQALLAVASALIPRGGHPPTEEQRIQGPELLSYVGSRVLSLVAGQLITRVARPNGPALIDSRSPESL